METTEPSVDEVGKGMKSGGKPKMQMGGMPPLAARAMASRQMQIPMPAKRPTPIRQTPASGAGRPIPRQAVDAIPTPTRPTPIRQTPVAGAGRPIPRQAVDAMPIQPRQMPAMAKAPMMRKKGGEVAKIKKELMSHEGKPASKAHKGLKTGGIAGYKTGGLIQKYATGGVVNGAAGYKDGGFAKVACKDGGGFKAMKKGNC